MTDATVDTSTVRQLLGVAQRQAAKRREEQLQDATVSLYRRLGLDRDDLADEYDATYGRPVDEDARVTYEPSRENHNPTSRMAGPMTWNTHRR
jgi:hypothetical protein